MRTPEQLAGAVPGVAPDVFPVIDIPTERFNSSPLDLGWVEVACYPPQNASNGEYVVAIGPPSREVPEGERPWDNTYPTYGAWETQSNPNGELRTMLQEYLGHSGLAMVNLTEHTRYRVTPWGAICRTHTLSLQERKRKG